MEKSGYFCTLSPLLTQLMLPRANPREAMTHCWLVSTLIGRSPYLQGAQTISCAILLTKWKEGEDIAPYIADAARNDMRGGDYMANLLYIGLDQQYAERHIMTKKRKTRDGGATIDKCMSYKPVLQKNRQKFTKYVITTYRFARGAWDDRFEAKLSQIHGLHKDLGRMAVWEPIHAKPKETQSDKNRVDSKEEEERPGPFAQTQPMGGPPPAKKVKTSAKKPYKVVKRYNPHPWEYSDWDRSEEYTSDPDFDVDPPVLRQWIDQKYGLIQESYS